MRFPGNLAIMPDTDTQQRGAWKIYRQRDFTGGENKLVLPEFMAANQLITAKNCVMSAEGTPETRLGKYKKNTVDKASPFDAMFRYSVEAGDKYVVVQMGTSLFAAEWDGDGAIPDFGTAIGTLTNAAKLRGTTWKDMLILTNGVDAPFRVNSSLALTNLGGTPVDSKIAVVYGGRLWLVDETRPNVLCPSELEDYDSYDALDEIKVRDGDGDIIMGLSPQPGGLVIFKSRSIWVLYGTNRDNWQLSTTPLYTEGLIGRDAFVNEGVFMGQSGFYNFNLSEVTPIFSTHKPVIQGLTLAEKQATIAVTDALNKRILFHLGDGDTLCIQEQEKPGTGEIYHAITTWTGIDAESLLAVNDRDDACQILIGDDTAGIIYTLEDETDDNGTAIPTEIQFAYNDFGSDNDKEYQRFTPSMQFMTDNEQNVFTFSYDIDYGVANAIDSYSAFSDTDSLIWGTGFWDEKMWAGAERVTTDAYLYAIGKAISFAIASDQRIKLLDYTAKYCEKEPF